MAGYRISRTAEDIKREIIDIMRGLKDPRISGMLTVVRVDVSSDLSFAKVYVSAMEGMETAEQSVKGLNAAAGFVRREISGRLHLRKAPELKFIADDSVEYGMKITKKLDEIAKEDAGSVKLED